LNFHGVIQLFEDLATELQSAWIQQQCDESVFPELAQRTIERFSPASFVAPNDVFRWLVETDRIPRQFDSRSSFGNFSLTLAARDGFHIDLLVWTDSTTSIHQHAFSGAFHVLSGSSLHTLWSFQESRRWSDQLKGGRLVVQETEPLRKGDTRPISPGEQMIHSLFHLESPSMTVVARTPSAATMSPPLRYERSGLAFNPYFEFGRVEKLCQLLRMLWASEHPQRMALSKAALHRVDAQSAVRIIFSLGSQAELADQKHLAAILADHDGELATMLSATLSSRARVRRLVNLRKQTRSPRHRLFLALVLNLPDRTSIDAAVRQIAPDDSPENWLWDTICSMHDTPQLPEGTENILGVSLNEVSKETLELLIRGQSIEKISRILGEEFGLIDDVRVLCSTLSAIPVLAPVVKHNLFST
jgi:hypothetical protein